MDKQTFHIKENSWIAWIAAKKLQASSVAIVFGKTVHLHNATKQEFLQNKKWVKHEMCHIRQYRQHGFLPFLFKYILQWIRYGYYNNKFEREARNAENDPDPVIYPG